MFGDCTLHGARGRLAEAAATGEPVEMENFFSRLALDIIGKVRSDHHSSSLLLGLGGSAMTSQPDSWTESHVLVVFLRHGLLVDFRPAEQFLQPVTARLGVTLLPVHL